MTRPVRRLSRRFVQGLLLKGVIKPVSGIASTKRGKSKFIISVKKNKEAILRRRYDPTTKKTVVDIFNLKGNFVKTVKIKGKA